MDSLNGPTGYVPVVKGYNRKSNTKMKGGENMGNPTAVERPASYVANQIGVRIEQIWKETNSCIESFSRVFGHGQPPSIKVDGKKQPEQELPFNQINDSLDRILDDLKYLAGRMDSEL